MTTYRSKDKSMPSK